MGVACKPGNAGSGDGGMLDAGTAVKVFCKTFTVCAAS